MKPLQPTGYRESPYERPGRRFVCGRPDAPCGGGPDAAGCCPVDPPCRLRLGERAATDDARCLECHFTESPTDRSNAALPHSVSADRTARATAEVESPGGGDDLSWFLGTLSPDAGESLACASCHRDHQGAEASLTDLADASCQVCHARRFAGLGDGHADFQPVPRPPRGIRFDHGRHREADHFGDRPFSCARCHVAERAPAIDLQPFKTACRGCHNQGREDHHGQSIGKVELTLLQLPEMELSDSIVWPRDAAWGDDVMPPLMRLLLLGDDDALGPLERIEDEADGIPYDWLPDDDAAPIAFTDAIKRLVADLAGAEPPALRGRLARALDAPLEAPGIAALADQLAGARFAAAAWRSRWLPGLGTDGSGGSAPDGPAPDWPPAEVASGWRVDAETGTIHYAATGHADPVFRALIEALGAEEPPASGELRAAQRSQLVADLFAEEGGPLKGACMRCHVTARPETTADWRALGRGDGSTGFRRFNHQPHTEMLRDPADCARCHVLQVTRAEGALISRGFAPHDRATCTACHHEGGAGEACLLCHDYHLNRP